MKITSVAVKNFRLLKDVNISLEDKCTVIVGRNNSGKTSLTEIFRRLLSDNSPYFNLFDFNIQCIKDFKRALSLNLKGGPEEEVRKLLPFIEITLTIGYDKSNPDLGLLTHFIIDMDPDCSTAIIKISYQLEAGKIAELFEDICDDTSESINLFIKHLRERIPALYRATVTAIDPTDSSNTSLKSFSTLQSMLGAGFINAQRGLDDITHSEKDVLGKILGKLFKTAASEDAPPDMKIQSEELKQVLQSLQKTIDDSFSSKVNALIPALKIFGYPGLGDPNLTTETTLKVDDLLDSNTRIRYKQTDGMFLPETYNGLGSRNLIYMLFQLFEFFRAWQLKSESNGLNLIFIEEPEAHLHPQMQQVFIRQINAIVEQFSNQLNNGFLWPVQFIITTHSSHIANEASFETIRYFLTSHNEQGESKIKDFRQQFADPNSTADKEFLHKYLTLTKCDLFFADKAILIEGTSERILMPVFVQKVDADSTDNKLASQFISVIEVGGAYAHHFYKFLDFLELRSLVITDLDGVTRGSNGHQTVYTTSLIATSTHSSNAAIKHWFDPLSEGHMEMAAIRSKTNEEKISGNRRICFQVPEQGKICCARSFEDAFILANCNFFKVAGVTDAEQAQQAFDLAKENGKTEFAMIYGTDITSWTVPMYLKEGLEWLSAYPNFPKTEVVEEMTAVTQATIDDTTITNA